MRVLLDFQIFQIQKYGGISRYLYEIATRLAAKDGVSISVFRGFNQSGLDWSAWASVLDGNFGLRVPRSVCQAKVVTGANYLSFSMFQRLKPRFDILHLSYYPRVIINRKSAGLVVSLYDMIPERFPDLYRGDAILERRRRAFLSADLILSISHASLNDLVSFYDIDRSKTRVIHLASSISAPNAVDTAAEAVSGKAVELPFLLYVGAREGYKNFAGFLAAYGEDAQLRQNMNVICFGSTSFTDKETHLIRRLGLENKVWHSSGSDNRLAWYYQHAIALVYPSLYEGFGLPLVEAMSLGCPVAASNRGSIPEVLQESGVLFDPEDQSAIQTALRTLSFDENKRAQLIAKGLRRAVEFSWEKTAIETFSAYQSIVH